MADPWQINQLYLSNLAQQTAQKQNFTDNALLRMFGSQIARTDAATAQDYGLEDMAEQNRYARAADTTQFDRQIQRDNTAYKRQDERDLRNRGWDLSDAAAASEGGTKKLILEQQLLAEREALERGDVSGKARRFGSFGDYISTTIDKESGGNPNAQNAGSSAGGLGQFTDGTWQMMMRQHPELGLTPNGRTDPDQALRAMGAFTEDNANTLRQNGIEPTSGNKYAAHFLGAGGAIRVLRQSDDTPLDAVVSADKIAANPHLRGMTVGQFKQWAGKGYSGNDSSSPRRYTDPSGGDSVSNTILNQPVQNTAAAANDQGITPVSPGMQKYLDEHNLEAVGRTTATETQAKLIPEFDQMFMPDLWDANQMNNKKGPTEYIQVQPRANQNPDMTGLPTPKKTQTEAPSVEIKEAPRVIYKDGKAITLDNGTKLELAD